MVARRSLVYFAKNMEDFTVLRQTTAYLQRQNDIQRNIADIRANIQRALGDQQRNVRLVAVSKTKPVEDLLAAYDAGQREFGENYVQELVEKAPRLPSDISWRFIGHLQTNKVKLLTSLPNLSAVETVDSAKLATALDKSWIGRASKLSVFAQVNTSCEENKHGVLPEQVLDLVRHIQTCPNLQFQGLMTIGEYGNSIEPRAENEPNPDFVSLSECRNRLAKDLGLDIDSIELSMGMSHDYIQAIKQGSTNVRVGSSIFGARDYAPSQSPEEIHKQRQGQTN